MLGAVARLSWNTGRRHSVASGGAGPTTPIGSDYAFPAVPGLPAETQRFLGLLLEASFCRCIGALPQRRCTLDAAARHIRRTKTGPRLGGRRDKGGAQ